jgi:long-chain acyl-CoA synthetase
VQTETRVTSGDAAYDAKPWLRHYPPDVPGTLPPVTSSLWEVFEDTVARHGHRPALIFQGYEMAYRDLHAHACRMSDALTRAGVRKGDVVLLLLPNVPHFPIAYYGALRLGAIVAAVPPTAVEREVEQYIRDTDARIVVTLDLLFDKLGAVSERYGVQRVVVGKVTDFMPPWVRLAGPFLKRVPKPKRAIPFGGRIVPFRFFQGSGRGMGKDAEVSPDDVALLQYTGGTTGTPKGAMLTHGSLLSNAQQMVAWFPTLKEGGETMLAVLPFFHVYGVTLVMNAGLLLAARTVLIASGWAPQEVFEAIRRYRPSIFPGVPTLYVAFLNDERSKRYDLSSIDVCVCGGAPLPAEVKRRFEELTGGHLYEGYGLSEASPCTHAQPYTGFTKPGIGLPIADTEARIVDSATGKALPVGEAGELIIRGPQLMTGYWRRPEDTADVIRDGWLYTGDVARMDEDGFFTIVDRRKDLIITGGENIYPREIEEVLFEHPKIKEAAVAGVPHQFGGEIAKAFIVVVPGEELSKKEVVQFCTERLSKHKVPRAVEFRTELPKSASGKVLRRVLAEQERARFEAKPPRRRQTAGPGSKEEFGPTGEGERS